MLPDPLTYSLIPEKKNTSCSSYIHCTMSAWRHLYYVKQYHGDHSKRNSRMIIENNRVMKKGLYIAVSVFVQNG